LLGEQQFVAVPRLDIKELPNVSMSGSAVADGIDTLVFTTKTKAYSTTGQNNIVDLAKGWSASEFNVLGEGGATATFNAGASLIVKIELTDNSKKDPVCSSRKAGGFGAETNNLKLGKCASFSGKPSALPYIQFTGKAPKN